MATPGRSLAPLHDLVGMTGPVPDSGMAEGTDHPTGSGDDALRIVHPVVDDERADAAVAAAFDRYAAKRPVSAAQAEEASRYLPAGSTRSVLDFRPFPFRVAKASGSSLIDVDGHTYTDLLGDYSAGLLGHDPDPIHRTVSGALEQGWSLGAVADTEHELARLVCERFPSIEQVRFTNSGTEANLMAISTARHHTGRDRVMVFDGSYHGGLLYFGATASPALQAPYDYVRLRFNDTDALAAAFEAYGAETACLLIEPMLGSGGCIPAKPGFLAEVRRLCSEAGVLLIFDEVMTSRMSRGGAQQRTGVHPDLTTLGKYLGGGMTFGAFGGRADVMGHFDPARGGTLTHGGTFNNNALTMRAGVTAIGMLDEATLEPLFDRGERLCQDLDAIVAAAGMSVTGWGSLLCFHPVRGRLERPDDLVGADPRLGQLLFHHLLDRGYYLSPRGYMALSVALTDEDLSGFVQAVGDAVTDLTAAGVVRAE